MPETSAVPASVPAPAPPLPRTNGELVSYRTLRRVVGVLGVSMPVVVAVWGFAILAPPRLLDTISDYYGLRTRDVFVGVLFTIAWFLYTYRGYERRDDVAGDLACLFALGAALFPNSGPGIEPVIHYLSATMLFLVLAYFSLFLFTKTGGHPTPQKVVRNRIYRGCGMAMLACIALMGLYGLAGKPHALAALKPVFWLETFTLWAFGLSWFVKGETLWRDPPGAAMPATQDRQATEHRLEGFIEKVRQLAAAKTSAITAANGRIRRAIASFRKKPRTEIAQDWHAVRDLADRTLEHLASVEASEHDAHVLASVYAYLDCARAERDFADAWSFVNMADALLPLVVPAGELDTCTVRLRVADERLPDTYREVLGHAMGAIDDGIGTALAEMLKEPDHREKAVDMLKLLGPAAAFAAPALRRALGARDPRAQAAALKVLEQAGVDPSAARESQPDERHRLHAAQLARAFVWNSVNRHISLKLALWRTILAQLAVGVLAAIVAMAMVGFQPQGTSTLATHRVLLALRDPVAVLLFGFFGGTLSAFLTARDAVVEIPSYQLIKRYTWLRMTLGAAGALVVYVVVMSLASNAVQDALRARSFGFMATAVAAGFSERLFVSAIEKAAENLHLTGTTKKAKESKPARTS